VLPKLRDFISSLEKRESYLDGDILIYPLRNLTDENPEISLCRKLADPALHFSHVRGHFFQADSSVQQTAGDQRAAADQLPLSLQKELCVKRKIFFQLRPVQGSSFLLLDLFFRKVFLYKLRI
jgi:hypothetical protein